ncbi:MAG: prepilin-type N-terminal cleavage/methylation domain-containing protein [Planctomycetaceae bacterium]|nr:prepilin-type N-terminal cleavage/methylation domain-containing protein [Planctomycetaceae bacterium]
MNVSSRHASFRHAMTLTELLVVMAVLAVLVTLLISPMGNMMKRVSFVRCQSNLARIAQAATLQNRDSDPAAKKALAAPQDWHVAVLKDIDNATSILQCPEGSGADTYGRAGTSGAPGANMADETMRNFLRDYRYRIGAFTWMFWTNPDGSKISAQQRWGFSTPWEYFAIDGSYFVRRVSDTGRNTLYNAPYLDASGNVFWYRGVYNTFLLTQLVDPKNSDGSPRSAVKPQQCMVMSYAPDSNPHRYWVYSEVNIIPPDANINLATNDCAGAGSGWGYSGQTQTYQMRGATRAGEDRWYTWEAGGYNFPESPNRDSCLRITHTPEGTTEISIRTNQRNYGYSSEVGFNGYCPNIVKKAAAPSADTVAVADQQGQSLWGANDPELYEKVVLGTPTGDTGGGTEPDVKQYVVSYGINPQITSAAGLRADRILAIDYNHLVVDKDNSADQADWANATVPFARHDKKVNVVFRSGDVHTYFPTDIDPTIPSNYARYWGP